MGGKSKQTSSVTIDPAVMSRATGNYDANKAFADTPATPYGGMLGANLDTSASQGTLNDMMGFNAPQVSWNNVSTDRNVSNDQIQHYMDPYLSQVVDATGADMEHARQVAQNQNKGMVAGRAAFGNGRRGIYEAAIDGESQRNLGSVLGGLRSQGFGNAVNWGQGDLARMLQAATTNSAGQLQAGTANQGAAINSANIRSGAATSLASLLGQGADNERANQGMTYAEFVRQQNDPLVKRGLLNQSLASIPVPKTETQTTQQGFGLADYFKATGQMASAVAMSDARLKADIEPLRTDDAGRNWYTYRYLWEEPGTRREGVMAQELQHTEPERVLMTPSGFYAVDYAGLI